MAPSRAVMIQGEIPGDSEQPAAQVTLGVAANRRAADPEEDLLRQIACRLGAAHCPAEVPEEAAVVRGEEPVRVRHACPPLDTPAGGDPLELECGHEHHVVDSAGAAGACVPGTRRPVPVAAARTRGADER